MPGDNVTGVGEARLGISVVSDGRHGVWAEGGSARLLFPTLGAGGIPVEGVGHPALRVKLSVGGWGMHGVAIVGSELAHGLFRTQATGVFGVFAAAAQARLGRATGSGHFVYFSAVGAATALRVSGAGRHGVAAQSRAPYPLLAALGVAKHPVAGRGVATLPAPSALGAGRHAIAARGAAHLIKPAGVARHGVTGHASANAVLNILATGTGKRGKVWVRMVRDVGGNWPASAAQTVSLNAVAVALASAAPASQAMWGSPKPITMAAGLGWMPAQRCSQAYDGPFGLPGTAAVTPCAVSWSASASIEAGKSAAWSALAGSPAMSHRSGWLAATPAGRDALAVWSSLTAMLTAARITLHPWGGSRPLNQDSVQAWTRYSRVLAPGWGIIIPGTPLPNPGESIIIPVRSVYLVVNEVQLLRVSNMTPITASQINVSFDCDSWLPKFSATIHESSLDAVMPDPNPVEVEASINGVQFRFFVERVTRSRQFARRSVTISGRGIACELDAPYAVARQHTNPVAMTAQQLIDAAIINTGYSQTWGIADWLVSANALSLYGSAAQVAGHVAEAAGSVLAADWALRDLRMLPRYPIKPWNWLAAVPDFVIPGAVTQTDSLEWIEKPSYNVVYVSGVQAGILAQVKITGTAGDLPAPMVTHPLITHADAGRQRGISILSDTGRKAMMQITLPVLESTGVIDICRLIEFNDGNTTRRGIVRANNVSANWPRVRQTLTVEANA